MELSLLDKCKCIVMKNYEKMGVLQQSNNIVKYTENRRFHFFIRVKQNREFLAIDSKIYTFLILSVFLLSSQLIIGQVGIGTTNPKAKLDVNGNLRIATTPIGSDTSAKDSILVVDGQGIVKRISAAQVTSKVNKSIVKGGLSTSRNILSIRLGSWRKLEFNDIAFDVKSEFNTKDHVFKAKSSGIYRIDAKITTNGIFIGDIGLAAIKTDLKNKQTYVYKDFYANIGINVLFVNVGVNPPSRVISGLVRLEKGETLEFGVRSTVNIGLLTNSSDTYFNIEQVAFDIN